MDHPLPFFKRLKLRIHLSHCYLCRRYVAQADMLHKTCLEHERRIETGSRTCSTEKCLSDKCKDEMKKVVANFNKPAAN